MMTEKKGNAKRTGSGKRKSSTSGHASTKKKVVHTRSNMDDRKQRVVKDNPAKSVRGVSASNSRKRQRENKTSRKIGFALAAIQLIISLVFMAALYVLNMLPAKYMAVIGVVLLILLLLVLLSQLLSKKKGIAGKIISVLLSIILAVGSFYIWKTNGTVKEISGGDTKLDRVVVAVLADDPAETIQDAASYSFGVQYVLKGEDIRTTVSAINEELGREIATVEYNSVQEQATALHDGEVDAIIYNEAYTGILEEEFEDYSKNVKIIYTYSIKSKLENKAADIDVKNNTFSVYISGIDVYGAIETNSRSDVNIIAVVNTSTHQILLVTTPRDYYVEIPGISGGQKDKLTHAGIYGVDASMTTLGQLYGTELDFYARVNFTSLIQMVDALGGVDVYSEQTFTTSDDSGLVMNVVQGENHFNGQQALAFSRERMNVDGGDFQRGKNQQAVIVAMIKKAISPAILMGANGILDSVSGNVDTNMSQEQIQTLIKSQLDKGGAWKIKSIAAEGTGDSQCCYSSGDSVLYVTQPNEASVEAIKTMIDAVEQGQVFDDSEVAQ